MVKFNNEELLEVLPTSIIETRELTNKQKVVLAQLIIYNGLEQTKNEGFFYRSNKDLMNDCEITEMTLITAIRKLDALGFIERKQGKRGVGASEYRINENTINNYNNHNSQNNIEMKTINIRNRFEMLPSNIIETQLLTEEEKTVLAYLISCKGLEGSKEDGCFNRTEKKIGKDCNITQHKVLLANMKLQEIGLISYSYAGHNNYRFEINEKAINNFDINNTINYSDKENYSNNYSNHFENYSNNYSNELGDKTMINNELIEVLKEIRDEIKELRNTIIYSNHYNKNYSNHFENYSTDTDIELDIDIEKDINNNINNNNIIDNNNININNNICTIKKEIEEENKINEELRIKELEELEIEFESENSLPTDREELKEDNASIETNDTPKTEESETTNNGNTLTYEHWKNTFSRILKESELTYEKFLECSNREKKPKVGNSFNMVSTENTFNVEEEIPYPYEGTLKFDNPIESEEECIPTEEESVIFLSPTLDEPFGATVPSVEYRSVPMVEVSPKVEYRSIPTNDEPSIEDILVEPEEEWINFLEKSFTPTVEDKETEIEPSAAPNDEDVEIIHQENLTSSEPHEGDTELTDSKADVFFREGTNDELVFEQIGILLKKLENTEDDTEFVVRMGKFRRWLLGKGVDEETFRTSIQPRVTELRNEQKAIKKKELVDCLPW